VVVYSSIAAKFCFPEDDTTPARRHPPAKTASSPEDSLAAPRTRTPGPRLRAHGELTSCYSPHPPTSRSGLWTAPPPLGLQTDVKRRLGRVGDHRAFRSISLEGNRSFGRKHCIQSQKNTFWNTEGGPRAHCTLLLLRSIAASWHPSRKSDTSAAAESSNVHRR
jgi:hypothetical protein